MLARDQLLLELMCVGSLLSSRYAIQLVSLGGLVGLQRYYGGPGERLRYGAMTEVIRRPKYPSSYDVVYHILPVGSSLPGSTLHDLRLFSNESPRPPDFELSWYA